MHVAKGLVIADPWIGYILEGRKTWEMRSSKTSVRGPFALIRKGTGAIWGVATLVDVGDALAPAEMLASFEEHRMSAEMIRSGQVAKWNTPWILTNIRRLAKPVPYEHPSGAVTWVNLADDVSRAIAVQLDESTKVPAPAPARGPSTISVAPNNRDKEMPPISRAGAGRLVVQTQLSEGNVENNHFYLRGHVHRFPSDLVGGSSKAAKASRDAVIDWGGASPATTDIDGKKEFFRGRGWIKQFFESTGARPGDWVLVEETGPYRYKVSLRGG